MVMVSKQEQEHTSTNSIDQSSPDTTGPTTDPAGDFATSRSSTAAAMGAGEEHSQTNGTTPIKQQFAQQQNCVDAMLEEAGRL